MKTSDIEEIESCVNTLIEIMERNQFDEQLSRIIHYEFLRLTDSQKNKSLEHLISVLNDTQYEANDAEKVTRKLHSALFHLHNAGVMLSSLAVGNLENLSYMSLSIERANLENMAVKIENLTAVIEKNK